MTYSVVFIFGMLVGSISILTAFVGLLGAYAGKHAK